MPTPHDEKTDTTPDEVAEHVPGSDQESLTPGNVEVGDATPGWVDLRPTGPSPSPVTPAASRRSPVNTVLVAAAAAGVALAVAAGGFAAGTQHAALGPVVVRDTAAADSATWAQKVYAATRPSVVEILVPGGGAGSGFFYRPDRIVTNAHVVTSTADSLKSVSTTGSFTVKVRLADGRERKGKVLAIDARTDLAVVEVPDNLGVRPLAFAKSNDASPGQPVAVIGHPFGQGATLSTGVLSAQARNSTFASSDVQQLLLQTDAAVNPGNSGGPLLDATGAVLGVVTLRPDTAEGRPTAGVAFALPANQVHRAIGQLERTGKVTYPLLGVSLRTATPDDQAAGAVIQTVTTGGPADKAGLRRGDVITKVADVSVSTSGEAVDAIADHRPHEHVAIVVHRAGKPELTFTAELAERR